MLKFNSRPGKINSNNADDDAAYSYGKRTSREDDAYGDSYEYSYEDAYNDSYGGSDEDSYEDSYDDSYEDAYENSDEDSYEDSYKDSYENARRREDSSSSQRYPEDDPEEYDEDREYGSRYDDENETAKRFLRNNPAYREPALSVHERAIRLREEELSRAEALRVSAKERAEELRRREREEKEEKEQREREEKRRAKERKRQRFLKKNRKKLMALAVAAAILAVLLLIAAVLYVTHRITDIEVTGNTMLTDEEIIDEVCQGPLGLGRNSLYLSYKYRDKEVKDIPFVEKMTVDILSPTSIRITVYEKALAGYVNYLGDNMYFTRDGTVVEASDEKVDGIPEVTGLKFDYILLSEKLPVSNAAIFDRILDTTQLLSKYDLAIDRIYFDSNENLTLFSGDVRIDLGQDEYTEEKIDNLSYILPKLKGRSGTIDMTGYTPDQTNISFRESGIGSLENLTGQETIVDENGEVTEDGATADGTGNDESVTESGDNTATAADTAADAAAGAAPDTDAAAGTGASPEAAPETEAVTDAAAPAAEQTGSDTAGPAADAAAGTGDGAAEPAANPADGAGQAAEETTPADGAADAVQ